MSLVLTAGIGIHTGTAGASMCDTTSGSNCTGPQPTAVPVPGESATIDSTPVTGIPFAKWNGQVYPLGQTTDPTACPNEQIDSTNLTCDHFQLTTQNIGTVTVLLTWPTTVSTNDFDLLVCVDTPADPFSTDGDCLGGTFVKEDLLGAVDEPGFATVTFPAAAGITYDIRALPFSVVASGYTGCAAYGTLATSACGAPPPPPPPPPATSTICPTNSATANLERRITGGANLTPDGSGSTHEHASLNVAHKIRSDGSSTLQGKVNYRKDDQIEFKSSQISCATFYDGGTDSNGDPKGSAEIRGFGKLETEDPTTGQKTKSNSCFRAFARDNGDPGGSKDGGSDQFSIEFTPPTTDPTTNNLVCTFNDLPADHAAPPIYSGNLDYKLKA